MCMSNWPLGPTDQIASSLVVHSILTLLDGLNSVFNFQNFSNFIVKFCTWKTYLRIRVTFYCLDVWIYARFFSGVCLAVLFWVNFKYSFFFSYYYCERFLKGFWMICRILKCHQIKPTVWKMIWPIFQFDSKVDFS